MRASKGVVDAPIGRDVRSRTRMSVTERGREARGNADDGADAADHHALGHEHAQDRVVARAERLQDGDFLALLGHHQEERADDAEARDRDCDRKHDESSDFLLLVI